MDTYTVIVFSDGYKQADFTPVKLLPGGNTLDLMLIPKDGHPNFADATRSWIKGNLPFLAHDVNDAQGKRVTKMLLRASRSALPRL